jgi:hypothetical protein
MNKQKNNNEKERKIFLFKLKKSLKKSKFLNKKFIEDIFEYFKGFGYILECRVFYEKVGNKGYKGYGFVLFKDKNSVKKVMDIGKEHKIKKVVFECQPFLKKKELKKLKNGKEKKMKEKKMERKMGR